MRARRTCVRRSCDRQLVVVAIAIYNLVSFPDPLETRLNLSCRLGSRSSSVITETHRHRLVMGSTPSKTQVRSIKLPQNSAAALMPIAASEACARTDPHRRVAELEKQLSECESRCTDAEEQAKAAERQVRS